MQPRPVGGSANVVCERNRVATSCLIAAACCAVIAGCGRAGGQTSDVVLTSATSARSSQLASTEPVAAMIRPTEQTSVDATVVELETLRQAAQFDEFVAATLAAAAGRPDHAAVQCLASEAYLATGDNASAAASALQSARLAIDQNDHSLALRALRLWVVAMMRQGQPLRESPIDTANVETLLCAIPADQPGAALISYWLDMFDQRKPFAFADGELPRSAELAPTKAADGTIWADLNSVEVTTNGVLQPMVFIDTGAQHTIMTLRAAENAGVTLGHGGTELVGFAGLDAQPAVLDTLDLGGLVLHNVPVLVGNVPALMKAKGQMALGAELMHHVRFTLDYPARRVLVERADRPAPRDDNANAREWPLWTFSQACLALGQTDRGPARVLVDTGNRPGTYLSARWARRHLPQFERPTSTLVFKFRHQGISLDTMQMGDLVLADWPIWDRIPRDLEQLDLVDVLVGRDLLWSYRLTIDLRQRVMRMAGGPARPCTAGRFHSLGQLLQPPRHASSG